MISDNVELAYQYLYRFSNEPYHAKEHWCLPSEFVIEQIPQVGGSGEIRTPDSFVRSEIL